MRAVETIGLGRVPSKTVAMSYQPGRRLALPFTQQGTACCVACENEVGTRRSGQTITSAASAPFAVSPRKPVFAMTCGGPDTNPCDDGDTASSFSGLGQLGVVGCSEMDILQRRLGGLLAQYKAAGGARTANVDAAQKFFNEEDSFFSSHVVAFGSVCTDLVAEANAHIANMTSALKVYGAVPPSIPGVKPPEPERGSDVIGTVKVIAIAGAVIAGAALLVPIVAEIISVRKLSRKGG